MKATMRHWFRVALHGERGATHLVAASGEHLGQAIADAERGNAGAFAVAVETATGDEIPLGESVGKGHVVALGEAPAGLPAFRWPSGVIPALGAAHQVGDARRGWMVRRDDTLLVIEAQTEADHLTDLFLGLIERLPAADNLEVRVLDHFEDAGTTDVWLTSRVDARRILRFLDDYDVELLGNGHLELSIYVRKHKATLRLTEHKTVLWLAEDRALEPEIAQWLGELGVPRVDRLVTVRDAAHFHYRPAKSRDRKRLGEELYRQRLRKVDTIRRSTTGTSTSTSTS
jgi:hypothetical protein